MREADPLDPLLEALARLSRKPAHEFEPEQMWEQLLARLDEITPTEEDPPAAPP